MSGSTLPILPSAAVILLMRAAGVYPDPPRRWEFVMEFIGDLRQLEGAMGLLELVFHRTWGDHLVQTQIAFLEAKLKIRWTIARAMWAVRHRKRGGCGDIPCGMECILGLLGSEVEYALSLNKIIRALRMDLFSLLPAIRE